MNLTAASKQNEYRNQRQRGWMILSAALLLLCCGSMYAVSATIPPFPGEHALQSPELEVSYDRVELDMENNIARLSGNVNIIYQDISITADEVTLDNNTSEADASGNVILWRDGQQWFGEQLRYNFKTGRVGFSDSSVDGGWVFFEAPLVEIQEDGRIVARDAKLTTCDMVEPHYHFKVKKAVVSPRERFWIYNSTLNVGKVPVAWLPFFSRSLKPEDPTWIFTPGYSKKKGAMVMNKIAWTFNDYLHLRLYGDYYSELGPGLGLKNRYQSENKDNLQGFLYGYYLFGDGGNDYVKGPPDTAIDIDDDRWKIAGQHWQKFGERTTLSARYQFLSDPEFNDDFKEQELLHGFQNQGKDLLEYERNSFVNLAHRTDYMNMRLTLKVSEQELYDNDVFWNQFPEDQRLPQLRFDAKRMQLFGTPFYFKAGAEVARFKLEQQLIRDPNLWLMTQEVDRAVFDAELSLPLSLPLGLRLIPMAAYRGSYYNDPIREFEFNDQDKVLPDNDGYYRAEFDDIGRNVGIAGAELVERLIFEWDQPESSSLQGLRLVTEPRVGFYYREPDVDFDDENPDKIVDRLPVATANIPYGNAGFYDLPFDSLDQPYRTEEQLEFQLETKVEGKLRSGSVQQYAKHSFSAAYDFEPEHDHWTELISELWLTPHPVLTLYNFLQFDPNEGELMRSNSSLSILPVDRLRLTVGVSTYKVNPDDDDQEDLRAVLSYRLSDKYSLEFRHRYDLDDNRTRENRLTITRDMHDLLGSLILREKNYENSDHEFEIMAVVMLKFPASGKVYGVGVQEP